MTSRVILTSNCMTGGLAASFSFIFRDASVVILPFSEVQSDGDKALSVLRDASVWFSIGEYQLAAQAGVRLVKQPNIHLKGFIQTSSMRYPLRLVNGLSPITIQE